MHHVQQLHPVFHVARVTGEHAGCMVENVPPHISCCMDSSSLLFTKIKPCLPDEEAELFQWNSSSQGIADISKCRISNPWICYQSLAVVDARVQRKQIRKWSGDAHQLPNWKVRSRIGVGVTRKKSKWIRFTEHSGKVAQLQIVCLHHLFSTVATSGKYCPLYAI
ncbi:conserved hypothetical protein [Trichinella spiralis]|uniref:hypothetical protein n=1 Tax=Trichinella spiralis TaxID=6334 RepID=UPI0001EFE732|nr:conserved hypothetical protein [Trichinella spiralis]